MGQHRLLHIGQKALQHHAPIALVLDGILQQLIASVLMGLDRVLGHHEVHLCSGDRFVLVFFVLVHIALDLLIDAIHLLLHVLPPEISKFGCGIGQAHLARIQGLSRPCSPAVKIRILCAKGQRRQQDEGEKMLHIKSH